VKEVNELKDSIDASAEQKQQLDVQFKDSQFHTKISPSEFQQVEVKFEQTFDFSSAAVNDNTNFDISFDFASFSKSLDSFGKSSCLIIFLFDEIILIIKQVIIQINVLCLGADTFGSGITDFETDSVSQQVTLSTKFISWCDVLIVLFIGNFG
jgi:hypothetical protein